MGYPRRAPAAIMLPNPREPSPCAGPTVCSRSSRSCGAPARPVTADAMADELETSLRTVYRDIADLMAQRVPIRGEAGVGYVLDGGFDMPPLMLTPDEIEAAVLGAQWVAGRGDPALAPRGARPDRQDRRGDPRAPAALPDRRDPSAPRAAGTAAAGQPRHGPAPRLRSAPDARSRFVYRDEQDRETERTVWPFARRLLRDGAAASSPGANFAPTSATSAPIG